MRFVRYVERDPLPLQKTPFKLLILSVQDAPLRSRLGIAYRAPQVVSALRTHGRGSESSHNFIAFSPALPSPDRKGVGPCWRFGNRRGNSLVETALWFPVLILLLFGMIELGRVTYTYYAVQKVIHSVARHVATLQAANLCDTGDGIITQAKTFAMSGSVDSGAPSLIRGLTSDMIQVQLERQGAEGGSLETCDCGSITQCDIGSGALPPDFVLVSIPDGYPVTISFPYASAQVVLFKPSVRVPFGGT